MGWTDGLGFLAAEAREFCLFHGVKAALGPIQPFVQEVLGLLPPGVKRPDVKLTTHFHLVPRRGMVALYLHSRLCVHDVVLTNEPQIQLYLILYNAITVWEM
jgi:hypothetical protein